MAIRRADSGSKPAPVTRSEESTSSPAKAEAAQAATERKGWISTPKLPARPGWLGKASAFVDAKLGIDTPEAKRITLSGVTAGDFDKMESKVRDMEKKERPFTPKELGALKDGQVVSYLIPGSDGLTDQVTTGVIDMPMDKYLQKVPLEEWGANIADYRDGEVKKFGPHEQIERMVLAAPGKDLDMTKVERLYEDRDAGGKLTGAQVRWEVLKTDNGTVQKDIGVLRFSPFPGDPKRTLVTWHNAVQYGQFPFNVMPKKADKAVLGLMVPDYFKRTIEHQRATVAP